MLHKQYTSRLLLTVYVNINSYLVCYCVLDACRLETWFLFTIHIEEVNNKSTFHSLTTSSKVMCSLKAIKPKLPLWKRGVATWSLLCLLRFYKGNSFLKVNMIGIVD